MGSAASVFLEPKLYLPLTIALPVIAWLAPPHFALVFTVIILWLVFSSHRMASQLNDDGVSDKLATFRKQLFGMMIIVAASLVIMAVLTYTKMRSTVVGPSEGNAELVGLYNGYRGFRLGYAVIITVFSLVYAALQTKRTLATNDSLELSKMQHIEAMWVGTHAQNIMGGMVTLWTTTLLLMAVAPTTLAQNLKPLLATLGDLRMAAGAA